MVAIHYNMPELFDVTAEAWYFGYLNANQVLINSLASKVSFRTLRIIGVEGDLEYGKRTHSEWHYLQQDLERGVKTGTLKVRPQFVRIPLEDLEEELDWSKRGTGRKIIIASVPARIGDNKNVMQDVEALCSRYEEVHMTFSRPGDLVDEAFESSSARSSGGAANTLVANPPQPPRPFEADKKCPKCGGHLHIFADGVEWCTACKGAAASSLVANPPQPPRPLEADKKCPKCGSHLHIFADGVEWCTACKGGVATTLVANPPQPPRPCEADKKCPKCGGPLHIFADGVEWCTACKCQVRINLGRS